MKFEVSRDDMRTLLRNVTRAINRKTEREILSNAFVSIDDEKVIQLGCTDTEDHYYCAYEISERRGRR